MAKRFFLKYHTHIRICYAMFFLGGSIHRGARLRLAMACRETRENMANIRHTSTLRTAIFIPSTLP